MTDMSRIKSKGTRPELDFQIANPEAIGHPPNFPFHPDFLLGGKVVFIDSDFWHCVGKINWTRLSEFWQDKLLRNLARDLSRESFYRETCLSIATSEVGPVRRRK